MKKWDLPKGWRWSNLGEYAIGRTKTLIPSNSPNQYFELYSLPGYDTGRPEIVLGKHIGSTKQIVEEGMVLLSKINPKLNRSWTVGNYSPYQKIASSEWIVFPESTKIIQSYLEQYLRIPSFRDYLVSRQSGIGGSLMRIKLSTINNYPIPVPPLETQQKIVAILDKVEEIKRLRAEANAQTQKLIQSVFLDMFGDPVKNTKHFEKRKIGDLVNSIEKVDSSLLDQFYYIDIDSIDNGLNIVSNPKNIKGIEAPSRARQLVRKDDILFSTVRPYLKNIAIVPEYLDGQVASTGFCILRSNTPEYVPFLFHLLMSDSFVDSLKEFYRGANYPAINPHNLLDYKIPFPPSHLLVEFNVRSRQIDTNLKNQSIFLNEMTQLDKLLTSKAFKGELVA